MVEIQKPSYKKEQKPIHMPISRLKPTDAELIERGLKVLSPVWTAAILIQLSRGKKRTKNLLNALRPLSAKTFSERIQLMLRLGLVTRKKFRERPPRVEYSLTAEGEEAVRLLGSVKEVTAKLTDRAQKAVGTETGTGSLKVKKRK